MIDNLYLEILALILSWHTGRKHWVGAGLGKLWSAWGRQMQKGNQ